MNPMQAGLPNQRGDAVRASYIGEIAAIPQPSNGIYAPPDGTKWLASGAVIPAAQSPTLLNTDMRCVKANLDINLPVTLTAAARFALTNSVTWIIDAAGAVLYSTDATTWNNTTPSGGGSITFILGWRNTGSGIEVFAGSSTQLFRAVITNAAPQAVAWSMVATISNTTNYSSNARYAFDGTNHLICWAGGSTGFIYALTSENGTSWSENGQTATDAQNSGGVAVTTKPGGGFRVAVGSVSGGSSNLNIYSTASGATFTKLNPSGINFTNGITGKSLFMYVGARLFLMRNTSAVSVYTESQFSDDDGVSWTAFNARPLYSIAALGVTGVGGASWDGTTLAFVGYSSSAGVYLISTADGINFKSTQLFMSSAEISSFDVGQVVGQRFLFIPPGSTKNKLFSIQNSFTPNASTDFVGLANRNTPISAGQNNLVYGVRVQ